MLDRRAFLLRFFDASHGDRLLLLNLGSDLQLSTAPEPLLAPPRETRWEVLFHTDDQKYGGLGAYAPDAADGWRVPGRSAIVLKAVPRE